MTTGATEFSSRLSGLVTSVVEDNFKSVSSCFSPEHVDNEASTPPADDEINAVVITEVAEDAKSPPITGENDGDVIAPEVAVEDATVIATTLEEPPVDELAQVKTTPPLEEPPIDELAQVKTTLASKEEELTLALLRIESLNTTKASLLDTIQFSARKLIPSALAAKDAAIEELKQNLENATKDMIESKVMVISLGEELKSVHNEKVTGMDAHEEAMTKLKEEMTATLVKSEEEKEAAVNAHEEALTKLKEEMTATLVKSEEEKEAAMNAHEEALTEQKEEMTALLVKSEEEKEAAMNAHEEALTKLKEEMTVALAHKNTELSGRDEALANLERRVAEADETIIFANIEIAQKDQDLATNSTQLAQRDAEIATFDKKVTTQQTGMQSMEASLANVKNDPLVHLQNYLAWKDDKIADLEGRLINKEVEKVEDEKVMVSDIIKALVNDSEPEQVVDVLVEMGADPSSAITAVPSTAQDASKKDIVATEQASANNAACVDVTADTMVNKEQSEEATITTTVGTTISKIMDVVAGPKITEIATVDDVRDDA